MAISPSDPVVACKASNDSYVGVPNLAVPSTPSIVFPSTILSGVIFNLLAASVRDISPEMKLFSFIIVF